MRILRKGDRRPSMFTRKEKTKAIDILKKCMQGEAYNTACSEAHGFIPKGTLTYLRKIKLFVEDK